MKVVLRHGNRYKLKCDDCGCVFQVDDDDFEIKSKLGLTHLFIDGGFTCPECNSINNQRREGLIFLIRENKGGIYIEEFV